MTWKLVVKWGDKKEYSYDMKREDILDIDWNHFTAGDFYLVKASGIDLDSELGEDNVIATRIDGKLVFNCKKTWDGWYVIMFCLPPDRKDISMFMKKMLNGNSVEPILEDIEEATSFHVKTASPSPKTGQVPLRRTKRSIDKMCGSELCDNIHLFAEISKQNDEIEKRTKKLRTLKSEMSEIISDLYILSQKRATSTEKIASNLVNE